MMTIEIGRRVPVSRHFTELTLSYWHEPKKHNNAGFRYCSISLGRNGALGAQFVKVAWIAQIVTAIFLFAAVSA